MLTSRRNVVVILCNKPDALIKKFGDGLFYDMGCRAVYSQVTPFLINLDRQNLLQIQNRRPLTGVMLSENGMVSGAVPFQCILSIFDNFWTASANHNDYPVETYRLARNLFRNMGLPFVNPLGIINVCVDKWNTYQAFVSKGIRTPFTMLFSLENLREMLSFFDRVVCKSRTGTQGIGQLTIVRANAGKYRIFQEGNSSEFNSFKEMSDHISIYCKDDYWIIQEAIDVLKISGGVTSIRFLFQRSIYGKGVYVTPYVCVGRRGLHVSNFARGGGIFDLHELGNPWMSLHETIEIFSKAMTSALEDYARAMAGLVGGDILIEDRTHNLLALEINSKPSIYAHYLLGSADMLWKELYKFIYANVFAYCRYLGEQRSN